jgi:hypothetical protein
MLPPELTAAIASLAQRDQSRRVGAGRRRATESIAEASTLQKGTVELADDGEDAPDVAVQGNDYRLPTIARKTADQVTGLFAPVNDNDLWFNLVPGRHYHFRFVCAMRSDSSSVGFRIALTFPSAAVFAATVKLLTASNGSDAEAQGAITNSGSILTFTSVPSADKDYVGTIEGIVAPSAAGQLHLQFGSQTGSADVTIRKGSVGFLYDLGA